MLPMMANKLVPTKTSCILLHQLACVRNVAPNGKESYTVFRTAQQGLRHLRLYSKRPVPRRWQIYRQIATEEV